MLATLASLGLAAVPAAQAQQSLYVANDGHNPFANGSGNPISNGSENTITKFNSAGVGTQFNTLGPLNGPAGLAFGPSSPAAVPEASTTVSLGLLLSLGLGGMVVAAKRRKA